MSWIDYLWSKVHRAIRLAADPLETHVRKLIETLAYMFEQIRDTVYLTRAEYFISKASADGLIIHGNQIRFPKFENETTEAYRARLLAAYNYFRKGGTLPGMKQAFIDMGYPNIEIVEHYKDIGTSAWAEFSVISTQADWEVTVYEREQMDVIINRMKPAHTRGAFRFQPFITDSPTSLVDKDLLGS